MNEPSSAPAVTVVVPAFNEAASVGDVVRGLHRVFERRGVACEVIVVDDGSSDDTSQVAAAAGAVVVRHPRNVGYGRSIVSGTRRARSDRLAIVDADGTYDLEPLPDLVADLAEFDMVVGARRNLGLTESPRKRVARSFLKLLAEYVAGASIPDVNSGMRAFRRELMADTRQILCGGFSFTTTITVSALSLGRFVKYVDVDYHARRGSHVRRFRDTLRAAQILVQAIVYYNPLKAMLPMVVVGLAFAIGFAIAWLVSPSAVEAVGAAVCLLLSMVLGAIGLLLDALRMGR